MSTNRVTNKCSTIFALELQLFKNEFGIKLPYVNNVKVQI